jgi:hypothetical protein
MVIIGDTEWRVADQSLPGAINHMRALRLHALSSLSPVPRRAGRLWLADMYFSNALLVVYGLSEVAAAFKLPFHIPWVTARFSDQVPLALPGADTTPRIAIVGAGAGGSSAAFWIGKAKERYGLNIEIDIFDSKPYIGGRKQLISSSVHMLTNGLWTAR